MNNFSIILCTCDDYFDLCFNCIKLIHKYWPQFDGLIYINSDTKSFDDKSGKIKNVYHASSGLSWSQRLFDSLAQCDSEFVSIFLEDFYIESYVNNDEFLKCLRYMQNHKNINSIIFSKEPGIGKIINELPGFAYRRYLSPFKLTTHIGIYRKSFLLNILKKNESAWEFETSGSVRSLFKKGRYICKADSNFTFPYHYGLLVSKGKYHCNLKSHFEEKEGIIFKKREVYQVEKKSLKTHYIKGLKYFFKGLFSMFSAKPRRIK